MSHGMGQYFDGKDFALNMTLEALPKLTIGSRSEIQQTQKMPVSALCYVTSE